VPRTAVFPCKTAAARSLAADPCTRPRVALSAAADASAS